LYAKDIDIQSCGWMIFFHPNYERKIAHMDRKKENEKGNYENC
jgi:hypothetical protein